MVKAATATSSQASQIAPAKSLGAMVGKPTATGFAASQGFSNDFSGVIELIIATTLSVPRTILDNLTEEYAPSMIDDMLSSLKQDLLDPLLRPLQDFTQQQPLEQANSIISVFQLIVAVVLSVPRVIIEGLTGMTIMEIQQNTDWNSLREIVNSFLEFMSIVTATILTLLKFVFSIVGTILSIGTSIASGQATAEELLANTASFLTEDLVPTIVDGFVLLVQQWAIQY
jgi:hypothetical protein